MPRFKKSLDAGDPSQTKGVKCMDKKLPNP